MIIIEINSKWAAGFCTKTILHGQSSNLLTTKLVTNYLKQKQRRMLLLTADTTTSGTVPYGLLISYSWYSSPLTNSAAALAYMPRSTCGKGKVPEILDFLSFLLLSIFQFFFWTLRSQLSSPGEYMHVARKLNCFWRFLLLFLQPNSLISFQTNFGF